MNKKAVMHVHEVRPRKDKRGFDLISDALPFGRLWYGEPDTVSNMQSATLVIRVYDEAGNVIETHEHKGEFKDGEFCSRETKSRHTVKRDG